MTYTITSIDKREDGFLVEFSFLLDDKPTSRKFLFSNEEIEQNREVKGVVEEEESYTETEYIEEEDGIYTKRELEKTRIVPVEKVLVTRTTNEIITLLVESCLGGIIR